MLWKERNGIHWLEFELFQGLPLTHALFLRNGGVSPKPFFSLNFSPFSGDTHENVQKNIEMALSIINAGSAAYSHLEHSNKVIRVDSPGLTNKKNADALSTSQRGLALMTTYADCQCALIYDPVKHIAGNVHSGWRGCVKNIYKETVEHMKNAHGSKASDLLVGIGPSLSPERAEFMNYAVELPKSFLSYRINEFHFDFWNIAYDQLKDAGVSPAHIEIAKICTYNNPDHFFSYRRDKLTGRHAGFIALQ